MTSRRTKVAESGFTLAELSLVVALAGTLAAVAWPQFRRSAQRLEARAAADACVEALRAQREGAVLGGIPRNGRRNSHECGGAHFFPDGTAEAFERVFGQTGGARTQVRVEPDGTVTVREL